MPNIPAMEITVTLGGITHKRDLAEDLNVNEDHINQCIIDAPGKTAWWHRLYEAQRTKVQKHKVKLERKEAELDRHYRKLANDDNQKLTDKAVSALIRTDEEFQALEDELLELQETLNLLKGAVEAIKELRSTLIQLSANLRTEYLPNKFGKTVEKKTEEIASPIAKKLQALGKS